MSGRLFLLDARHGVERTLLLERLRCPGGNVGATDWVAMPAPGRRDPRRLRDFAERLGGIDDTQLIPLRVAWRTPYVPRQQAVKLRHISCRDPRAPGPLRARAILARDAGRAQCLQAGPLGMHELRRQYDERHGRAPAGGDDDLAFATFVLHKARLALDGLELDVQGGRYRRPRFLADGVERLPGVDDAVERLALSAGRDPVDARRQARRFLRELVSRPSAFFLDLRNLLDRFLWLRGYDREIRFDAGEFERLRATVRTHPTVLLFTHKTYGDAALPGMMAYACDLPALHTFGGLNLDLPGFGTLMRRSGGIFIRRSFRDDPLYKLVVGRYVGHLLSERFPLAWSLEGTRSRLGKLMPPRFGLLRQTLDAVRDAGLGELHVIPFVTSFELIRDVEEYVAEQRGRPKPPESLRWLLRYAGGAGRPMGRVRVDLGEAVVVRDEIDPGDRQRLYRVAFDAAVQANRATPLTVTGVICLLLLAMAPRGATAAELTTFVEYLAGWARRRGIRLGDELAATDHSSLFARLGLLAGSGLLARCDEGRETVYAIGPAGHPVASYYRNTIAHHFLDKSLLELAVLKVLESPGAAPQELLWREVDRLRELFKFEFFYPPREQYREVLVAELDRADRAWRRHLEGGAPGLRRLADHLQPFLGHAVLLQYVEAYSIVADQLMQLGPGVGVDAERCVSRALSEGHRAFLLRRIGSEAAVGRILLENGFRLAANLGLTDGDAVDVVDRRRQLLLELQSLGRRMERLRAEGLAHAEWIMAGRSTQ